MSEARDEKAASLATRKFEFEDIVNADPLCPPGALKVVRAYLGFVTNFESDAVYRSNIDLQVATGLSRRAIINIRRLLVDLGYFVAAGRTRSGAVKYQLRLARANLVLDHQIHAREKLREIEAERQEQKRQDRGGANSAPLDEAGGCTEFTYGGANSAPNYLNDTLEEDLYERNEPLRTEYAREESVDQHVPYPAPETEEELERALADLFDGCQLSPNLLTGMRKMLIAGRLTPAIVAQQREFAA